MLSPNDRSFLYKQLGVFVLCSLLIWCASERVQAFLPWLKLNDPTHRTLTWLICTMLFLIHALYRLLKSNLAPTKSNAPSDQKTELKQLEKHLQWAMRQLQPHTRSKTLKKPHLHLILGLSGSGRKTLLAHHPSATELKVLHQLPWLDLSFWYTQDTIYCVASPRLRHTLGIQHSEILWHSLCKQLKKIRKSTAFDAIHLLFPIASIHKPHESHQARDIDQFNQCLRWIQPFTQSCPTTITLSQADLICGFSEFFAPLSELERQSSWILHAQKDPKSSWLDQYDEHASEVIQTLHQTLSKKLHQEQNIDKRKRIHSFPHQIERLKQPIKELLGQLYLGPNLLFQRLALASGKQPGMFYDFLSPNIQLHSIAPRSRFHMDHPIFCADLFTLPPLQAPSVSRIQKIGMMVGSLAICLIFSSFFIQKFYFHRLKTTLDHTPTHVLHGPTLDAPIWHRYQHLHTLDTSIQSLKIHLPFLHQPWMPESLHTLHQHIILKKKDLMVRKIIPAILDHMANDLSSSPTLSEGYTLYLAYLSLQDLQEKTLNQHLLPYLKHTWPDQDALSLIHDLSSMKKSPPLPQPKIMLQWRKRLLHLPMEDKVLLMATERSKEEHGHEKDAHPSLELMLHTYIPESCQRLKKPQSFLPNAPYHLSHAHCEEKTDHHLIRQYAKQSLKALNQRHDLCPPHQTLTQTLAALSKGDHPLQEHLRTLEKLIHQYHVKTQSARTLEALYQSLHHTEFLHLTQTLAETLKAQENAEDPYLAAYTYLKHELQTKSSTLDQLQDFALKGHQSVHLIQKKWMDELIENIWAHWQKDAETYLSLAWQQSVMPIYSKSIAHHYPIDRTSSQDVSEATFTAFFGPEGLLNTFYNTLLQPLVLQDELGWHWQTRHGRPVIDHATFLDPFMLAEMIQKSYFPFHSPHPTFHWALTPIALASDVSAIDLILGPDKYHFDGHHKGTQTHLWPTSHDHNISMTFFDQNHQPISQNFRGPWAILHLFDQATIEKIEPTHTYHVTFALQGFIAHYELELPSSLHPFLHDMPEFKLGPLR